MNETNDKSVTTMCRATAYIFCGAEGLSTPKKLFSNNSHIQTLWNWANYMAGQKNGVLQRVSLETFT